MSFYRALLLVSSDSFHLAHLSIICTSSTQREQKRYPTLLLPSLTHVSKTWIMNELNIVARCNNNNHTPACECLSQKKAKDLSHENKGRSKDSFDERWGSENFFWQCVISDLHPCGFISLACLLLSWGLQYECYFYHHTSLMNVAWFSSENFSFHLHHHASLINI